MCLAVPGKVIRWLEHDPPFAQAEIDFGGISRRVWMSCVDGAVEGDYVLVHAGMAIARIDEAEAERTLAALAEIEELDPGEDQSEP